MKKKLELTDEQKEIVKLMERKLNITFKGCYMENGVPTWKWVANDNCEITKMLVEIYGKDNGNKKD